ncbi:MAG: DUF1275 domain-containing protein [Afipia sp.]|nr:DUF1275 domain-containing protein [Afipia sp.]OJW61483.1 MAG: hypothetical protein BGO65_10775 [Afipia sp. 64-13]
MKSITSPLVTRPLTVAALLAFNGGFVDTAGFLGLNGLFVAHVTGNFVTLGAALVTGGHGVIGKILALPAFMMVIALARLSGTVLRGADLPARRILFSINVLLLLAFFVMAVRFGPFPNADSPLALLTGLAGIAAMAMQASVQRVHLAKMPPSTMMTGSTVQATLDVVDILTGAHPEQQPTIRKRFRRLITTIVAFTLGCASSALLYAYIGFWCLGVSVVIGMIAAVTRVEEGGT